MSFFVLSFSNYNNHNFCPKPSSKTPALLSIFSSDYQYSQNSHLISQCQNSHTHISLVTVVNTLIWLVNTLNTLILLVNVVNTLFWLVNDVNTLILISHWSMLSILSSDPGARHRDRCGHCQRYGVPGPVHSLLPDGHHRPVYRCGLNILYTRVLDKIWRSSSLEGCVKTTIYAAHFRRSLSFVLCF